MTIKGKDLIERISNKEYSEDLIKELEKYEIKKPKSVYELKVNDEYWRLDMYNGKFEVSEIVWYGLDYTPRTLGMIHLTKERAELHARVLNTELAIKKWKRENDNVELDWNDFEEFKYHFIYDFVNEKIRVASMLTFKYANTIYFSSRLIARQCIDDIGEERIIEWLKWEDNDQ